MKVRQLAPLAALLVLACGGKKPEAEPAQRTAGVIEKAPATTAPPEITPKPAEPAPAPRPTEPAPAPKPTEPAPAPKPTEPAPEPKPTEPAPEPTEPAPEPKPTEPVPEPKPTEPPSGSPTGALVPDLMVTDAAVTDAVVDRMPSARKTTWKIGEDPKLIGWFEFKNPGAKVDLDLVWKKNGTESWRFPTSVGTGKNWRTWAEKRIGKKDAGNWSVEVVDANGHVYETVTYTIE